tara:strand:- start:762 stop:5738 length:4977 start_codon:yes stop_codon:yes gene_type:complete
MSTGTRRLVAILVGVLILIMDTTVGAVSSIDKIEILNEDGFESEIQLDTRIVCDYEGCGDKDRLPSHTPIDAGPPVLDFGWWMGFSSDSDNNGMDDRLQLIQSNERESVSKTAIMGDDGRLTVAIIVHYAWHPGETNIESLRQTLYNHGWDESGSWFMVMDHLDAIVLDHVPVIALDGILDLDGVVLVEEQNVIVPYLDKATRGSKVRASAVYEDTIRGLGYDGSGIVIAILDTGVDNEHFSLDDFSDDNSDNTKEPHLLDDPKWVAGCDSTGIGSSGCNDEDPDDGDGHGTHVAGIAMGTGDRTRVNQGYAPGSYLVDVKVMQDYGGGNSQSILAGLQWVINNKDTDWGNNESSIGIQVVSMSFGRANSGFGDSNENGDSAEAQLVNQASEGGLVCVAAIGNDGANNVNSVGAADTAITVGWIDDKNTISRGDDSISENSNYGPRTDDGDSDSFDELKPWVVAPGSNINSAKNGESSGIIPGSENNRASDDYESLSGTSMSTPAVAGLIAIMMQIGEERNMEFMSKELIDDGKGIERYETIRYYLRTASEFRSGWQTDETYEGSSWNEKYGFGIIDGGAVAQSIFDLDTNGSGGPGFPRQGNWLEIESPDSFSWVIEGETYNLRGHINEHGEANGTIEEILVSVEMEYKKSSQHPREKLVLLNWSNPIGMVNWTAAFEIPELPEEYLEKMVVARVAARNDLEKWSNITEYEYPVGRLNITMGGPSGQSGLSGTVAVEGEFQSVGNATIQWRLDREDWGNAATYHDGYWEEEDFEGLKHSYSSKTEDDKPNPAWQGHGYCAHMFRIVQNSQQQDGSVLAKCASDDYGWTEWDFSWDTTLHKDDSYMLSVRLVSGTGVVSEEIRRVVTIDNTPPTPDLQFVSNSITVQEFGVPLKEAYVNTFLEVRATIRNTGDKAATEVGVILEEWDARRDEYIIPLINSGEYVDLVLYWNPSESGEARIVINIDPYGQIEELDEENNELVGVFPVIPRPPGIDLTVRTGAITTDPVVPRPFEQTVVKVRVDNLGSTDAFGVRATLEVEVSERGWQQIGSASATMIQGGYYSELSFIMVPNSTGPIELRVTVIIDEGSDLNWDNNARLKTILVDQTTLTGPKTLEFNVGEEPVSVVNIDDENGILISNKEGELSLFKISNNKDLERCSNLLDNRWTGDLITRPTEDGFAHIVWTRRFLDNNGFLMQTLSYATIDATCKTSPIQDLMPGLPLTDGKYWGIDLDIRDSEIVISGYFRDIFTGGTMGDETNIFMLYAEAPSTSDDWTLTSELISGLEIPTYATDPLAIEFGIDDSVHLLYQSIRNDTTGEERLGLWYAHGELGQGNWAYKRAVGDEASLPKMVVVAVEDDEKIVALWREGDAQDSMLIAIIADSTFSAIDDLESMVPARGMAGLEVAETERGVQVLFDRVGPSGPQVEYGIIDHEGGSIGLSNKIITGQMGILGRSGDLGETSMVVPSAGDWDFRILIDDGQTTKKGGFSEQLRSSLGLDKESFEILVIGVAFAVLILGVVTLVSLTAQGLGWARRRRALESQNSVKIEEDVVDLIDDSDLSVSLSEVEVVAPIEEEEDTGAERRRSRRSRRSGEGDSEEAGDKLGIAPEEVVIAAEIDVSKLGEEGTQVVCKNCYGRFTVGIGVSSAKCPLCDERVSLAQ